MPARQLLGVEASLRAIVSPIVGIYARVAPVKTGDQQEPFHGVAPRDDVELVVIEHTGQCRIGERTPARSRPTVRPCEIPCTARSTCGAVKTSTSPLTTTIGPDQRVEGGAPRTSSSEVPSQLSMRCPLSC